MHAFNNHMKIIFFNKKQPLGDTTYKADMIRMLICFILFICGFILLYVINSRVYEPGSMILVNYFKTKKLTDLL